MANAPVRLTMWQLPTGRAKSMPLGAPISGSPAPAVDVPQGGTTAAPLSRIVTVAGFVPTSVAPTTPLNVTLKFSSPSNNPSLIIGIVKVWVVEPAGKVSIPVPEGGP